MNQSLKSSSVPATNSVNVPQCSPLLRSRERERAAMKTILLVDDHPVVRDGLRTVIEGEEGLKVVAAAGSVEEALSEVEEGKPDLVLTDLSLPGRNGVELIKDLKALCPDLPVLVMSMHDELIYAERVLRAGGRGYIMKEAPSQTLIQAVRLVLGGGVYVSETVTKHFLEGMSGGTRQKASFPLQRLTDREMEVFELVGQGKGNQDIAKMLTVSPRTVDAHKAHIREKLGLADGNELTRYAVRWVESSELE